MTELKYFKFKNRIKWKTTFELKHNAMFTKDKICGWNNKNKFKRTDTEMETLFVVGTFPNRTKGVKRRNLPNSRVLHSFLNTGGSPT